MKKVVVCFGIIFLQFSGALIFASDWPQMYHDAAHTSFTTDAGPETGTLGWSYQIGTALGTSWEYIHMSSPAVVNGKVYVGSTNRRVYCFDHNGGAPIWTKQLKDTIFSSPAVVNGKLYVGTWGGDMYCLDANTGDSIWFYHSGGKIEAGPTVSDNRVFFGAMYQNYMWCLNANTGAFIWEITPFNPSLMYGHGVVPAVKDSLVIVGASIFAGDQPTTFYAYKEFSSTPDLQWEYTAASHTTHQSVSIGDGKVYGSVDDGWLYCMDEFPASSSGELIWSERSAPGYSGDPSCVSIEGDKIYYGHEIGKTYCRNATSGVLSWTSGALGGHCGVGAASLSGNGKIYVGTGYVNGKDLYCLDKSTGNVLWSYTTGGYVTSTPAISNGMVFVTSQDGYIYAFGTWVGEEEHSNLDFRFRNAELKIGQNPFIKSTIIKYQIPIKGKISLALYDISGSYAKSLVNEEKSAGSYSITLSVKELKAGMYFLTLNANGVKTTQKLTLLK
ncbi:MAG: PQQ-binding-like beta-propeller repeat protein [bacterium]|nr:PQQ-binding-like beta-propeller repeat protein [bacterium]